ncbi:nucleotide cyclase [Chytriomyces sp. MP71]|nr:nucleotide cyclase [Chytriomyces sp. MP71]
MIIFQEGAAQTAAAFNSIIREKRNAFKVRMAKMEEHQMVERNELGWAQERLADTVRNLRQIELKRVKNKTQVTKQIRENELIAQQTMMRQQKEREFLQTLQLCKARHASEINELEISGMEELEEIHISQRSEEFELISKNNALESDMTRSLEQQKWKFEADQLMQKQISARTALQRAQKKQANQQAKLEKSGRRIREKDLIAEYPLIRGEREGAGDDSASESASESQSEGTIQSAFSAEEEEGRLASINNLSGTLNEADINSKLNKEAPALSDEEKMMASAIEAGNESLKNRVLHHKKILQELKRMHKSAVDQKTKENRRKMSEILKDHEEEIEQLKMDQAEVMKEFLAVHMVEQDSSENLNSRNLTGALLPPHIMSKMELGGIPEAEDFDSVTIIVCEIDNFRKMTTSVDPVNVFMLLEAVNHEFDVVLESNSQVYKVDGVSGSYILASGLGLEVKTPQEVVDSVKHAFACALEIQKAIMQINASEFGGNRPISLRIGVHTGPVFAGVLGTKLIRYSLIGETFDIAFRMCETSEPGKLQVSKNSIQGLADDDTFEFEECGEVEVKGQGNLRTFWLLD